MSLLFADSFDHYTSASHKYHFTNTGGAQSLGIGSGGRFGTNCLQSTPGSGAAASGHVVRTLPVAVTGSGFVGVAFNSSLAGAEAGVFVFGDSATPSWAQGAIAVLNNGAIRLYRSSNGNAAGTILATSAANVIIPNAYQYIEVEFDCDSVSGYCEVHVGEQTVLTFSGNTRGSSSGNNHWDRIGLGFGGSSMLLDDLYVCNAAGSTNNDFLGDVRAQVLRPNANGSSSDWTRVGGDASGNYTAVDEATPNDDTDYVESGTPGDLDLYGLTNLVGAPATIFGVLLNFRYRKDDATAREVKGAIKSGSTTAYGTPRSVPSSYSLGFQQDTWETNPDTAAAFSVSEVNSLEAGQEVHS